MFKHWCFILLSVAFFGAAPAHAQCNWHQLVNGNTADASQVMDNFNCLAPKINPTLSGSILLNSSQWGLLTIRSSTANDIYGIRIDSTAGGNDWHLEQGRSAPGDFNITNCSAGCTQNLVVKPTGYIGIGTGTPTTTLQVNGTISGINGADAYELTVSGNTLIASVNGSFSSSNPYSGWAQSLEVAPWGTYAPGFYGWSDERLKKGVQPMTGGLALLDRLRPVRYRWRTAEERQVGKRISLPTDQAQIGFIAQEVEIVAPEAVTKSPDGLYALREAGLVPILVQAVKELHAEVEDLKAQLAANQAVK